MKKHYELLKELGMPFKNVKKETNNQYTKIIQSNLKLN